MSEEDDVPRLVCSFGYREAVGPPPVRAVLKLAPHVHIHTIDEKPNAWWRLWQWLLLGWVWEDL